MTHNSLTHLLDTSVYCQPLKKVPLPSVMQRWKARGDLSFCVSVFCEMEVLQGLHAAGSSTLYSLYREVLQNRLPILPFTTEEAAMYAELQGDFIKSGNTRPAIDLCIAATAVRHNLTLATLNSKDFAGIPNLRIEIWE